MPRVECLPEFQLFLHAFNITSFHHIIALHPLNIGVGIADYMRLEEGLRHSTQVEQHVLGVEPGGDVQSLVDLKDG